MKVWMTSHNCNVIFNHHFSYHSYLQINNSRDYLCNINIQIFWDMTPYMVVFPEFSEQLAACIFTLYVVTLLGLLSQ